MSRLDEKYRYYAFISYNHKDEREAKWLQRQLEHYRLPSVARKEIGEDVKIRPVFRYAVNLSLGDLRQQIKEELDASKYLIVICSPNSAQPNIEGKHWVNDEVTRFIETGRADYIIPVIVDGEPNVGGERECFPPALRNREIAGANLSKGSRTDRRNDFLKIVAKLLGILPDQLIRHTVDEERRTKVRFWLKLVPLAILLAVGGLFAWDATRTVSNYYADYVDSFGLPEGIFPLKKSDTAHRNVHYRFEYNGFQFGDSPHADSADWCIWNLFGIRRRLVRVVQANSHGLPCTHSHPGCEERPQMLDFMYDNDLRLCEIRYGRYNGEGQVPYLEKRVELSNEAGVVNGLLQFFSSEGRLGKAYAKASTTKYKYDRLKPRSEVTQHIVRRDARGRVEKRLFLNSSGANAPNGDGLYGFGYEYDDMGRQTAQWYLFMDGNEFLRHPNKKGVAGLRYEYFGRNIKKIENVSQNGSPVMGLHGWQVLECAFDANDNIVESRTYDERGNKVSRKDGYAELHREYDASGNMTRELYFDVDGNLTLHRDGYAEVRNEYDEHGNLTRELYFDVNGNRTLHKKGYAEVRSEYDARGHLTREQYFGVEGNPTLNQDGYAEERMEYDAHGKWKRRQLFGVDGKPISDTSGIAEGRREYDACGNITKESYFGVDGMPVLCDEGNAGWVTEHDARGNVTRALSFGVDGKPIAIKNGCAEVRREHDTRGNTTRAQFFGVDGKPASHVDGHAGWVAEYDARGNKTKMSYFGVDGKPVLIKGGYAEVRGEYDERGNVTKKFYLGVDGNPILTKDGYAEVRSEYDARGNKTKESYFGVDGKPVHTRDGYAEMRLEYDEYGNVKKELRFDANGKLIVPDDKPADGGDRK